MTQQDHTINDEQDPADAVRPVGAWVVGGFLLIVCFAIWLLVAAIFMHRA